jgi:tellurite methyltransferase
MSDDDRERWNQRYRDGAYEQRAHPSALVAEWIDRLPRGRALDVASGAGRNARFLNALGYSVTAIDISPVALSRLADAPRIQVIAHDLDHGLPAFDAGFDLVLKMRFLNLGLVPALIDVLNPGGVLVCEVLLQGGSDEVGPAGPRFRATPGALRAAADALLVMHDYEGEVIDPDGRSVHLARLIARKPMSGL